jgi:RNA polymerase sigma-70 factor, ECF subfamily
MPNATLEDSGHPAVTNTGVHVVKEEHRREFNALLPHALPRFRRMAMRWLRNHEDAEDAVQDAMLLAFRHISQFKGRAQLSTWLTAILYNVVRMQLRRPRYSILSLDHVANEGDWATLDFLADSGPTPERTLEQSELYELAVKLVGTMPPRQRAALQLCTQAGFSMKKAAEMLDVPEGTVKVRLSRARARLAERFHNVTASPKSRNTDSKTKCEAWPPARRRRDCVQSLAQLPIKAFREHGGCEGMVGA